MNEKEKKTIEITLKGIIYFITSETEQKNVLQILEECESKMNDNKLKDKIDSVLLKFKDDYFDKINFLIENILSSKMTEANKKVI